MNDRLISFFGAIIALALVVQILIPQQPDPEKLVSFPTTENKGHHGFWVLKKWLDQNKIQTISLRHRIDDLPINHNISGTGNIMIISLPTRNAYRLKEKEYLTEWISKGNILLVFAAMNDQPPWTGYSYEGIDDILDITELSYVYSEKSDDEESKKTEGNNEEEKISDIIKKINEPNKDVEINIDQIHPVFNNIKSLSFERSEFKYFNGFKTDMDDEILLPLLYQQDTKNSPLWYKSLYEGEIWFFTHADFVNNARINKLQNAQFISNLLALKLADTGTVIFDDFHQGLTDVYDPEAFFNDDRLHTTLWFILVFWLLYIIGHSNRFGPLQETKHTYSNIGFMQALANFIARQCDKKIVAKELLRHLYSDIKSKRSIQDENQSITNILRKKSLVSDSELEAFDRHCAAIDNNRKINLIEFYNQLQYIRKKL